MDAWLFNPMDDVITPAPFDWGKPAQRMLLAQYHPVQFLRPYACSAPCNPPVGACRPHAWCTAREQDRHGALLGIRAGCAQALRDEEGGVEQAQQLSQARKGHLRCLLHMGHHHSLLAQVDGWSLSCSGGR